MELPKFSLFSLSLHSSSPSLLRLVIKKYIMEYEDEDDEFFNEIIHCRAVTRRTNWRLWSTSLSQHDVAVASSIESSLLEEEDDLLYLRHHQLTPLITGPPRNRVIDELTDEVAYSLTRFTKEQLRILFLHLRIPNEIVTEQWHHFSGEEILIICLAKIATGDPWIRLIPGFFGGDLRRWSFAFRWFINHLFINFFHAFKIK